MTGGPATSWERRMLPVAAALQAACALAGLWMLWATTQVELGLAWGVAFVGWVWPTWLNLRYLVSHRRAHVGIIPPAIASLALPTALALFCVETSALLTVILWGILVCSCAVIAVWAVWFYRFHKISSASHAVANDATIIVLGGIIKDGAPCLTLRIRLDEALRLWQESPTRRLLLTGGAVHGDTRSEADYMADYLIERGISWQSLLLEPRARDTSENIRFSVELLEAEAGKTTANGQLCVLTNDYHLYRAVAEGKRLGIELVPICCPTPPTSRLQQWSREVLAILF